jgi:hypothetical protein
MKLGESESGRNVVRKHYLPLGDLPLDFIKPYFSSPLLGIAIQWHSTQCLKLALSKGPNRVSASPRLMTERDHVPEILCYLVI